MSGEIDWPVEYSREVLVGNLERSVAVCTLWSDKNYVAGQVGIENVVVIGNLYSHGPGIEGVVRNILANPSIRTIVVAGKDKSQSAETLLNLSRLGVEISKLGWIIPGPEGVKEDDLPPGRRFLDKEVPLEAIDDFRANVAVLDMRGKSWQEVSELVLSSDANTMPFAEPRVFPKSQPDASVQILTGEDVGFIARGSKPHEVWLEILRTIRKFGHIGESQWTSGSQELLNFVAVLDGELEEMMSWPGWVGHSPTSVIQYSRQLIEGVAIDKDDSYAYGERMRVRRGDQIGFLIKQLKKKPFSRSMMIDLWDVEKDWFGRPESPPCLTQAWFRVFKGRLCATFVYRSHDMFGAWIKNAVGDRLLQAYVSNAAELPLGSTTIISNSAHIYDHDFAQVDDLLNKHKLRWEFVEDPRGNVIITTEGKIITVRHENRSGTITTFKGKSALKLYKEIWKAGLVSTVEHGMYVGFELSRAEESVKRGFQFIQDQA